MVVAEVSGMMLKHDPDDAELENQPHAISACVCAVMAATINFEPTLPENEALI